MTDADKLAAEVERLNAQNHQLRLQVNALHDELADAERRSLEWQAALHHAETEARQCGFTGSIREPGPALLAILQERDALSHQLEADRTAVADAVTNLRRELNSRHWLTEGRGPYEWDDDRYREEFLLAGRALIAAIEPLNKVAVNWAGCPKTSAEVAKARIDKDARITELRCSLNDALESLDEALRERDEARAQAARLTEALRALANYEPDREPELDWSKWARKILSDTATDARAWLDEQIAAELERLACNQEVADYGIPYVSVNTIESCIAELRRREGV